MEAGARLAPAASDEEVEITDQEGEEGCQEDEHEIKPGEAHRLFLHTTHNGLT